MEYLFNLTNLFLKFLLIFFIRKHQKQASNVSEFFQVVTTRKLKLKTKRGKN